MQTDDQNHQEHEIWEFLDRHLASIFNGDWATYQETTADDLSLYEYWIVPHRQDGLEFHQFMIENRWTGRPQSQRFDLFEKRCQLYGDTAIVSYTLMLSQIIDGILSHHTHNESRVLIRRAGRWQVVHVHKSPAEKLPR